MRGTGERATGSAARPFCVFAQSHWPCESFRREYVGAPRPKPAPKSRMWKPHCGLSGLSSRCGGVGLVRITRRRHPGTRKDPSGSNLWPGGSGCIAIISTRTIGDLPDSDLWSGRSCCIARQQVEAALRPAASGSRTADYRSSSSASGYSMKPAGSGAGRGQSEVIR